MANVTTAVKSVLGTVSDTATTLSDTVKTVGLGVGMVNTFVEGASVDQKDRQLIHRATYRNQLIRDNAMDMARASKEVAEFCKADTENAEFYLQHEADLKALFA